MERLRGDILMTCLRKHEQMQAQAIADTVVAGFLEREAQVLLEANGLSRQEAIEQIQPTIEACSLPDLDSRATAIQDLAAAVENLYDRADPSRTAVLTNVPITFAKNPKPKNPLYEDVKDPMLRAILRIETEKAIADVIKAQNPEANGSLLDKMVKTILPPEATRKQIADTAVVWLGKRAAVSATK